MHEFVGVSVWLCVCAVCNVMCMNDKRTRSHLSKEDFALLFTYLFVNGTKIAKHRLEEFRREIRAHEFSMMALCSTAFFLRLVSFFLKS